MKSLLEIIFPQQVRIAKWVELRDGGPKKYIADVDYEGSRNPTTHFALYLVDEPGGSKGEWVSPEKIKRIVGRNPYWDQPHNSPTDLGIAAWSAQTKQMNESPFTKLSELFPLDKDQKEALYRLVRHVLKIGWKESKVIDMLKNHGLSWVEARDLYTQAQMNEKNDAKKKSEAIHPLRGGTFQPPKWIPIECKICHAKLHDYVQLVWHVNRRHTISIEDYEDEYGKVKMTEELQKFKSQPVEDQKVKCPECKELVDPEGKKTWHGWEEACPSCGHIFMASEIKEESELEKYKNLGKYMDDAPPCKTCKGRGDDPEMSGADCPKCGGTGVIMEVEGGLAKEKGLTEKDVDPKEFQMGIEVEKEHTDDMERIKQTVLDHLVEDPKYYTKLKKAGLEETINKMPPGWSDKRAVGLDEYSVDLYEIVQWMKNNWSKTNASELIKKAVEQFNIDSKDAKMAYKETEKELSPQFIKEDWTLAELANLKPQMKAQWTEFRHNEFSIEASDLSGPETGRNICPQCGKVFSKSDMTGYIWSGYGDDRELGGWRFTHTSNPECKARLTVFND